MATAYAETMGDAVYWHIDPSLAGYSQFGVVIEWPVRSIAKRALQNFWKRHPKSKGSLEAWHQGGRPCRLGIPIGRQRALSFSQRSAGQPGRFQRGGESVLAYREDQLPVPNSVYPIHRHTR